MLNTLRTKDRSLSFTIPPTRIYAARYLMIPRRFGSQLTLRLLQMSRETHRWLDQWLVEKQQVLRFRRKAIILLHLLRSISKALRLQILHFEYSNRVVIKTPRRTTLTSSSQCSRRLLPYRPLSRVQHGIQSTAQTVETQGQLVYRVRRLKILSTRTTTILVKRNPPLPRHLRQEP